MGVVTKKGKSMYRCTQWQADFLFWAIPLFWTFVGVFSEQPKIWYQTLVTMTLAFCGGHFVLAASFELISYYFAVPVGNRIQGHKSEGPKYIKEIGGSIVCMYIIATFATWPAYLSKIGKETAFTSSIEEATWGLPFPHLVYALKIFVTMLFADAHTFWKHYLLHRPSIYVFHKYHHQFHNPSTFAGYAIHPVEAFWTFCPILLMTIPGLGLYFPMHFPFLFVFGLLNLYLHCGYNIPFLERWLPAMYIDTSKLRHPYEWRAHHNKTLQCVWHNRHHEISVSHFGEMLTVWDYYMGTTCDKWDSKSFKMQSAAVEKGLALRTLRPNVTVADTMLRRVPNMGDMQFKTQSLIVLREWMKVPENSLQMMAPANPEAN